jgi:glycosyltransferase involved in cell wall biosynthesis
VSKSEYVLVIPSWFPSKDNKFNGDFNERITIALSRIGHQVVVYIVGDIKAAKFFIEDQIGENTTTIIGYYPKSKILFFGKFLNFYRYVYFNLRIINKEINKRGLPKYIHTYVFFPAGLISLYFKNKYQLKSILTEHWTAFYKYSNRSLNNDFFVFKIVYKRILKSFDLILPVAKALQIEMERWNKNANYSVIPNVVDTRLFNLNGMEKSKDFTFLHVSTLSYQKNPELLLASFEETLKSYPNLKLNIIGGSKKSLELHINNSSVLKKSVKLLGEIGYDLVALEMKKSHSLIMCSRFENLPCVILEALCCGLPVLSTDVGGISEVINHLNGILFDSENKEQTIKAMDKMITNFKKYNLKLISNSASKKYSYDTVTNQTGQALKKFKIITS